MTFSANILEDFLHTVYDGFDTSNEIEPKMWREQLRLMNEATVEGLEQGNYRPRHNDDFLNAMRHGNEVFAAFKTHAMGEAMAKKLYDAEGNLKSFDQWVDDVASISSHHVGSWLKTEYNTAVLRAHAAADWQEFIENKDIFPNLRWMPTTSPDAEASHMAYWEKKLTLPVEHPFWAEHHPQDRWNCKCSLEATDDPASPADVIEDMPAPQSQRGLENNPGKDGHLINDTHPYFPENCNKCPFYKPKGIKNRIKAVFLNKKKDCFNCPSVNATLPDSKYNNLNLQPPEVSTYKKTHYGKVLISPYHGKNELEENKRLANFLADKLKTKVYLLPRLDQTNKEENRLRERLLPHGVKVGKNPDFLINGMLFDGKNMSHLRRTATKEEQKQSIQNHIKKAKTQADHVVLEIPSFVRKTTIYRTMNAYLSQSHKERIILVCWKKKLMIFEKKKR